MAWCKSGTRTPGSGTSGLQNPSMFNSGTSGLPQSFRVKPETSIKFKSGTPGPPSKFKSGTPELSSKFKSETPSPLFN